jgi:hypothetical protein
MSVEELKQDAVGKPLTLDEQAIIAQVEAVSDKPINRVLFTQLIATIEEKLIRKLEANLKQSAIHLPDVTRFMDFLPPDFITLIEQRTGGLQPEAGYKGQFLDREFRVEGYVVFRNMATGLIKAHLALMSSKDQFVPWSYSEYEYTSEPTPRLAGANTTNFDYSDPQRITPMRDSKPKHQGIFYLPAGAGEIAITVPYSLPNIHGVQDVIEGKHTHIGEPIRHEGKIFIPKQPQLGEPILGVNVEIRGFIEPEVPVYKGSLSLEADGGVSRLMQSLELDTEIYQRLSGFKSEFWNYLLSIGYDLSAFDFKPGSIGSNTEELVIPSEFLRR